MHSGALGTEPESHQRTDSSFQKGVSRAIQSAAIIVKRRKQKSKKFIAETRNTHSSRAGFSQFFFRKGTNSFYLCHNYSVLLLQPESSHGQYVNEWLGLHS